jgi:glycopeptide antibiotics resistance protein
LKNETKQTIRRVGFVLFVIYMLILIYLLFFMEEYGRVAQAERAYRYNFTPFVEIHRFWKYRDQLGTFALLTNIGGNVVGFMPYGFILPVITRRRRSGFLIILSGFCISLTVEVIQLVTKVGSFDVDDIILNTLGVALGYLFFYICNALRRIYYGKKI